MKDNVNRADVVVTLKDVYGEHIFDEVQITFYNQKAHSLSQRFEVKFKGKEEILPGVPAFPTGLAEVFIKPRKYRFKSIFINVFVGEKNLINEDFFVDPDHARPRLMDFDDLPSKDYAKDLQRILAVSKIDRNAWSALDKRNRATILNLSCKMLKETTQNGQSLISQTQGIDRTWLDTKHRERIFAIVKPELLGRLRKFPERFRPVSGVLHKFPTSWTAVGRQDSFKTRESAGNIQLTFARNADGIYLADIDLDDHAGIKHGADVLRHKITGNDTDPYNMHQVLIYFQHLDPGYRLL